MAAEGDHLVYVDEVFSAIQGEGLFAGARQIFVRLMGCNIRCVYCDEPQALEKKPGRARAEVVAGSRDFEEIASPMAVEELAAIVSRLNESLIHGTVSITGGEPLIQASALGALLPELRSRGLRVALETNGTRPEALEELVRAGDIVSMDIKLGSVDGEFVDGGIQREFLRVALRGGADVYCKTVVSESVDRAELISAAKWISEVDSSITLFLQPVSEGFGLTPPLPELALDLQSAAMQFLADVRLLPQVHRLLGQK